MKCLKILDILERRGYERKQESEPRNGWRYENEKFIITVFFPDRVLVERKG
jgi:hypothetical protein